MCFRWDVRIKGIGIKVSGFGFRDLGFSLNPKPEARTLSPKPKTRNPKPLRAGRFCSIFTVRGVRAREQEPEGTEDDPDSIKGIVGNNKRFRV